MSSWALFVIVGLPLWLIVVFFAITSVFLVKNFSVLSGILTRLDKIVERFEYESPKIAHNITKTTEEIAELVESVKETVDVFNVTLVAGRTNWRMLTGLALPFVKRLMNRKGINPVKDFKERGKSKK